VGDPEKGYGNRVVGNICNSEDIMKKLVILPLVLLLLQFSVFSYAARVELVPGAKGVYYVKAVDFVDVGGVEVEIQYDKLTLSNPRITQGPMLASTMFIPNTQFSPSSVKIAAMSLSALKGSGDLAVITFDVKGDKAGPVMISGRPKLAATTGAKVPTTEPPVASTGGGGDLGWKDSSGSNVSTGGGSTGGGVSSGGEVASGGVSPSVGTITLPTDPLAEAERKVDAQPLVTELRKEMTQSSAGADPAAADKSAKAAAKDKDAEKKFESFKGVLELFKAFKGERTMASLVSLFAEAEAPGLTQSPPVALADGKSPVSIVLVLKASGEETPNFIMQGASVKQLSNDADALSWTIEAVPKKDVVEAKLTVINGASMLEYPLTVAPVIDPLLTKGKALSAADFTLYLAVPPKFDLNKDGKFDALDDFIYTANYIVAMKIKPEKSVKPEAKDKGPVGKKDAVEGGEQKPKEGTEKSDKKDAPADKKQDGRDVKAKEKIPSRPVEK